MIVAFSTSSPMASVALIGEEGRVVASASEEARMNASGVCLRLLQAMLTDEPISGYLADLGPGSFTGVRVGVTLAKTMALVKGVRAGGASAFDLISAEGLVVAPNKKGEFFWRLLTGEVQIRQSLPGEAFTGYGTGVDSPVYPQAARFAHLLEKVEWLEPELLLPRYLVEPSISTPNKPFREAHA